MWRPVRIGYRARVAKVRLLGQSSGVALISAIWIYHLLSLVVNVTILRIILVSNSEDMVHLLRVHLLRHCELIQIYLQGRLALSAQPTTGFLSS